MRTMIVFGVALWAASFPLAGSAQAQTRRVYVGNLTLETTLPEVGDLFDDFGTVTTVHMQTDLSERQPAGYAFVEMDILEADEAVDGLDGSVYRGRVLDVSLLPIPGYAGPTDEPSAPDWSRVSGLDQDGVSDVLDWMAGKLTDCERVSTDRRLCVNDTVRHLLEVSNRIGRGINSSSGATQEQWLTLRERLQDVRTHANGLR